MRAGLWRGPSEKAANCNPEGVSLQNPPGQLWEGDLPPQTPRVSVCRSGPRAVGFVWVTRCLLTWALGPWPPPSCCTLLAGRASGHFWRMGHVASARSWSGSNQTRYWPERDRARSCAAQTQGPGTDRQTPLASQRPDPDKGPRGEGVPKRAVRRVPAAARLPWGSGRASPWGRRRPCRPGAP